MHQILASGENGPVETAMQPFQGWRFLLTLGPRVASRVAG